MLKGKRLEKEIEKDSNQLREHIIRGKLVTPNITQYSEVSKAETKGQETGASWAVSSNRKNQPSDIYLWGTPSVTSH
jgi:hypothetical protein